MSTGGSRERQERKDQVPTGVTEKSSGLNYIESSIENFKQGVGERPPVTKNDKG